MNKNLAREEVVDVVDNVIPNIYALENTEVSNENILKRQSPYRYIKRFMDVILATIALVVLSPIFLIIAIAIKIESKGPVFFKHTRIGKNGKIIKLYDEDEEILEDAITENRQAIEMAKIYSDILNGTMDAYASIISNNLNGVMKFLTSITIVLAVPTMISSFWGMNVGLPFQDSPFGFIIMIGVSIILTLLVTWWLKRKDMLD